MSWQLHTKAKVNMRLLALCYITILCCSPDLVLAVVSADSPTSKGLRFTPPQTLNTTPKKSSRSIPTPKQRDETKLEGLGSRSVQENGDRNKNKFDTTVSETVATFFKREGNKKFGFADSEKNVTILRVVADPDFPDRRIVNVHQLIHGVPIFGARATLEVTPEKGVVNLTTGLVHTSTLINVQTIPTILWTEAIHRAVEVYRQKSDSVRRNVYKTHGGESAVRVHLTIFDPQKVALNGYPQLAWMVRLDNFVVFIDAHDGSTIFHYSDMQSLLWRRTYDLQDTMTQEHIGEDEYLVLDDNGSQPIATVSADARNGHEGTKVAYTFFKKLGLDSYDNLGSSIDSNVRVADPDEGIPYGQWDVDAKMSIYPSGIPSALDIVGHEFTHAVLQFMPCLAPNPPEVPYGGLFYGGESGALSEGLADFFGAQIEGQNWTIAENLPNTSNEGNKWPLRNMANPHKGVFDLTTCNEPKPPGIYPKCKPWDWNNGQPEHYSEKVTENDLLCRFMGGDNGCVHLNSGIFNKAVYLAAMGGDHHGVHVRGISAKKLTRILYRTIYLKLTTFSDLKDAAEKSVEACTDLKGKYQIKSVDCTEVENAFIAVGLLNP